MSGHYILGADARTPVPVPLMTWVQARGYGKSRDETPKPGDGWARVALDLVCGYRVSTVFMGLDHNFGGGQPVLFETMIFREDENTPDVADLNDWQDRYSTWAEAEAGHAAAVALVRSKASGSDTDGKEG